MKHLSQTLKTGLAALLLLFAQVLIPAQTAFATNINKAKDEPQQAFVSNPDGKKAYVCKYVGTPGTDETLQTGNNPISIDRKDDMVIGTPFTDAQGRSVVIGFGDPGNQDNEPTISDCPQTPAKTPVTAVNGEFTDYCGLVFNLQFTAAVTVGVVYTPVTVGSTTTVHASVTNPALYTLTNPQWEQHATDTLEACPPDSVTPIAPTIVDNPCGTASDTFAWTPVTGIEYYYTDQNNNVHTLSASTGTIVSPVSYTGGNDLVIRARVTDPTLFVLSQSAQPWTLHFTNAPCPADEPGEPTIQVICGANNDIVTPAEFDTTTVDRVEVSGWEDNTYVVTYYAADGYSFGSDQEGLPITSIAYRIVDSATACPGAPVAVQPTCDTDGTLTLPAVTNDDEYTYEYRVTTNFKTTVYDADKKTVITGITGGSYHVELWTSGELGTLVEKWDDYGFITPKCVAVPVKPVVVDCDTVTIPEDTDQIHYVESYTGTSRIVTATAQGKYFLDDGKGNLVKSVVFTLDFSSLECGKGEITPPAPTPTTLLPTPLELPRTGSDGVMGLVVALISAATVYGAVYFVQPRRP